MRLIADENIARSVIASLRERGYDVLSVAEAIPGASDEDVLRYAEQELRILLRTTKTSASWRTGVLCPHPAASYCFD
ncbi:MAG: DUF5615 family PIN-like protein [Phycisphaerae bacterium]